MTEILITSSVLIVALLLPQKQFHSRVRLPLPGLYLPCPGYKLTTVEINRILIYRDTSGVVNAAI